jgi:predicted enzyme related to lactoylglutathione lyase
MSNHGFVHIEFSATDPAQSAEFYSNLFGWEMHNIPEFDYWTFGTVEGQGGGFNKVGSTQGSFEVKPGDVIAYVNTDDIEGDLAKAQELGGTIVTPKMEIPGIGWYGIFRDPTGNQVGLYTGTGAQQTS